MDYTERQDTKWNNKDIIKYGTDLKEYRKQYMEWFGYIVLLEEQRQEKQIWQTKTQEEN